MRVFVAGATGAIGQRLVPLLIDSGHEVVGTTKTPSKTDGLRLAGATPVVLDGRDGEAVRRVVLEAEPDVVVHELTALSGDLDFRRFAETFAETNRLRTDTTDIMIEAAVDAGARRFIAQSFAGWPNEQTGGPVKTEEAPLNTDPPKQVRETLGAILHLEAVTTHTPGIEGLALRYGGFYGPGNALGKGGAMLEAMAKRQMPVVGGDCPGSRPGRPRDLQHRRRRACAGLRMVAVSGRCPRSQRAAPGPGLAGPAHRG